MPEEGEPLPSRLTRTRSLNAKFVVARYIFAQMLETVESLLDHGIVHCDIKDQNLTVDAQWKVRPRPWHP